MPEGREQIILDYDRVNGWFAHISGHKRETEVNGETRTEALQALTRDLEDRGWPPWTGT